MGNNTKLCHGKYSSKLITVFQKHRIGLVRTEYYARFDLPTWQAASRRKANRNSLTNPQTNPLQFVIEIHKEQIDQGLNFSYTCNVFQLHACVSK